MAYKTRLTYKQKYEKMSIEQVAADLWNKHSVEISTTGAGERMTEAMFVRALKSHYVDEIADGNSIRQAMRDAIRSYDRSATYRSKDDRYGTFKIYDLFGGKPNALSGTFQQRIRNKNGSYAKYDPNKLLFSHEDYDAEGKKYAEYTYTDNRGVTTYLRQYNSPYEWKLYDERGDEITIK